MDRLRVAALTGPAMTQLADVAALSGQYRQHYGEPAAPAQTLAWLTATPAPGS